jgi:ABC-type branched-subunit amino acid transport system substrate-binding protein
VTPKVSKTALVTLLSIAAILPVHAQGEPIKLGHLTYHTGPFGSVGEFFDGVTEFTLDLINEDPPLGRQLVAIHQDIGTLGEAQVARKLIESDGVEILLNPAHNYLSYRDFMLNHIAANGGPIMPSVHGGAIERQYGGVPAEPLFRGSPMDSAQGVAAVLHAKESGAQKLVIVATEIAGSQLQKEAAEAAAIAAGLEVAAVIDVQPQLPTYRSVVSRIANMNPDAVIFFSVAEDGGTFVKNAAESGQSWLILGTTEWQVEEFPLTATMSAIGQHQAVRVIAFTNAEGPAWDYFEPLWSASAYASLGEAENSYTLQYYDLLVLTALAIEASGSVDAATWTEKMHAIANGPGKIVHTYAEGVAALRADEDIDYDGISGGMNYTDTGVVAGLFGVFEWTGTDSLERVAVVDDEEVLALDQ